MRPLATVLTGLAVLAGLAPAATATGVPPKAVCNLVVDPVADVMVHGVVVVPPNVHNGTLDVLGADVATGVSEFVAVLRLRRMDWTDVMVLGGAVWEVRWQIGVTQYAVRLATAGGLATPVLRDGVQFASASVQIDPNRAQLRFSFPRDLLPELAAEEPTKIVGLGARAEAWAGGVTRYAWDDASSAATYLEDTPSCVRAA